ncbi:MAG TPA: Ig-like domain-containing protein [Gemmatimonadaceae bacterium]|nr:Ig-like domain-containing protein [Gemmatimonadaceae bacterium]
MITPRHVDSTLNRCLRSLALVFALVAGASCSDQPPVSPRSAIAPGHARFAVAPRYETAPAGAPVILAARAVGVLLDAAGDTAARSESSFEGDSATLGFDVQFEGSSAEYTLDLTDFDASGTSIFHGIQRYTLKPGENPDLPGPVMVYSAPDSKLAALHVAPTGIVTLNAGVSQAFGVAGTNAAGQPITPIIVAWTTNDPAVATVDANGVLVAGAFQGTTYVVARTYGNLADSALIHVHAPVDHIVIAPAAGIQLVRGKTGAVTAELRDAGGHLIDDRTAAISSSDPTIATVSSEGVVQGLKIGTATITASAEGKTATLSVAVVSPIDHIELSPSSLTLNSLRETQTLTARMVPRTGASIDGLTLTLTSSSPAIASVDASGTVTAIAVGSATITASADGLSATSSVTVRQVVASVHVSPKDAKVEALGLTQAFTAAVQDATGNPLPSSMITWSSSNPGVASIAGDGTAKALTVGAVTITATAGGLSDVATFTVVQTLRKLAPSVLPATIQVGQTAKLSAVGSDANGNTIPAGSFSVSWSSATPTLATVAGDVVTAVGAGTAQLTASANGVTATTTLIVTAAPDTSTVTRILIYGPSLAPATTGAVGNLTQPLGSLNRRPARRPGAATANASAARSSTRAPGARPLAAATFSGFQNEQTLAQAAGLQVVVADSATWVGMTTSDFASYNAIVFGDPSCGVVSALDVAVANTQVWAPAVTGPVAVIGTDYVDHQQAGGLLMAQNALKWVASNRGHTGLFVSLSCYYFDVPADTPLTFLSPLGTFTVAGQATSTNPDSVTIVQRDHPIMAGVTDASLSSWGESIHELLTLFPTTFSVIASSSDGKPYIIAKP